MKKAKLALLFLGLLSCAEAPTPSETQDIGDAISMTIREDGQFNIICKDGAHEVASVDDIRNDKICGGGGGDNGRSECKYAKLLLEVVKSLPEFSAQLNDAKEFNLAACAENRPSYYSNGSSAYYSGNGSWYYPNGKSANYNGNGSWSYPNGKSAYYNGNGSWSYPNGNSAYYSGNGSWSYPNGKTAYYGGNGSWYYPNGNTASPSGNNSCEKMTNLIRTTSDESLLGQMRAAKAIMCAKL